VKKDVPNHISDPPILVSEKRTIIPLATGIVMTSKAVRMEMNDNPARICSDLMMNS
jgi:hypothetical protein